MAGRAPPIRDHLGRGATARAIPARQTRQALSDVRELSRRNRRRYCRSRLSPNGELRLVSQRPRRKGRRVDGAGTTGNESAIQPSRPCGKVCGGGRRSGDAMRELSFTARRYGVDARWNRTGRELHRLSHASRIGASRRNRRMHDMSHIVGQRSRVADGGHRSLPETGDSHSTRLRLQSCAAQRGRSRPLCDVSREGELRSLSRQRFERSRHRSDCVRCTRRFADAGPNGELRCAGESHFDRVAADTRRRRDEVDTAVCKLSHASELYVVSHGLAEHAGSQGHRRAAAAPVKRRARRATRREPGACGELPCVTQDERRSPASRLRWLPSATRVHELPRGCVLATLPRGGLRLASRGRGIRPRADVRVVSPHGDILSILSPEEQHRHNGRTIGRGTRRAAVVAPPARSSSAARTRVVYDVSSAARLLTLSLRFRPQDQSARPGLRRKQDLGAEQGDVHDLSLEGSAGAVKVASGF
jgi:hypothetical protein